MIESQTLDELTEKLEKLAKEGGPAFPSVMSEETKEGVKVEATFYGATLRDYFAAKASEEDIEKWRPKGYNEEYVIETPEGRKKICSRAAMYTREQAKYRYADAMIEARK